MGKARILRRKALAAKDISEYNNFIAEIANIFKTGRPIDIKEAADVLKDPKLLQQSLKLRGKSSDFIPPSTVATTLERAEVPSSKAALISSIKVYEKIYEDAKSFKDSKRIKEKLDLMKKKLEEAE